MTALAWPIVAEHDTHSQIHWHPGNTSSCFWPHDCWLTSLPLLPTVHWPQWRTVQLYPYRCWKQIPKEKREKKNFPMNTQVYCMYTNDFFFNRIPLLVFYVGLRAQSRPQIIAHLDQDGKAKIAQYQKSKSIVYFLHSFFHFTVRYFLVQKQKSYCSGVSVSLWASKVVTSRHQSYWLLCTWYWIDIHSKTPEHDTNAYSDIRRDMTIHSDTLNGIWQTPLSKATCIDPIFYTIEPLRVKGLAQGQVFNRQPSYQ